MLCLQFQVGEFDEHAERVVVVVGFLFQKDGQIKASCLGWWSPDDIGHPVVSCKMMKAERCWIVTVGSEKAAGKQRVESNWYVSTLFESGVGERDTRTRKREACGCGATTVSGERSTLLARELCTSDIDTSDMCLGKVPLSSKRSVLR